MTMKQAIQHYILLLLAAVLCAPALRAESKDERAENPHELSIGVSDRTFARLGFRQYDPNTPLWAQTLGQPVEDAHRLLQDGREWENQQTVRLPHFFVEYQYRINSYIGVGLNADLLPEKHTYDIYNGYHDFVGKGTYTYYFMYFVPKVRFTFLHSEYVNLYASAGIGAGIEVLSADETFVSAGLEFEATLLGLSIGKNHFFGSVEIFNLGFSPAISAQPFKLISASVGYRF